MLIKISLTKIKISIQVAIGGEEEGIGTEVEEVLVVAVVGHVVVVEVYHVQEVEVGIGVVEVTVEIGEETVLVLGAAVHVIGGTIVQVSEIRIHCSSYSYLCAYLYLCVLFYVYIIERAFETFAERVICCLSLIIWLNHKYIRVCVFSSNCFG